MKQNKILSMLGICTRASAVVSGSFMVEKAVKSSKAYMVVVASDASEATKKDYRNMCAYYHVPLFFYSDKETLGHAIGKEMRVSAAVTDAGLANALSKLLEEFREGDVQSDDY